MAVQAVLESQDDAGSLCLEADVFYADNRLDKSRVRITLEKSASAPQQGLIRIRSAVLIDEPVVTFTLRVGCQLKTERRYVILADLLSEAAPDRGGRAVTSAFPPALPSELAPVPLPARSVANSAGTAAPGQSLATPPVKAQSMVRRSETQRALGAAPVAKAAAPARARLKLEPLDLAMDRDPQLKPSAELLSIPAANPQERAAASALWRALSAQPQDILRDTEKLQSLESSVRSLQAQSQKTTTSIDDLNIKLQQAQTDRYANAVVYALILLLLAALAGLAYLLWYKTFKHADSGDKPWWRKNNVKPSHQQAWVDSLPPHEPYQSSAARFASEQKTEFVDIDVDFGLDPAGKPPGAQVSGIPAFVNSAAFESRDKSDFSGSLMHPGRAIKAEELFDVQQQADFFVSIGQHEQAIELLRSHIAENSENSALIYLDLFNLYHQLGKPAEYEALRITFNQRFNTQIPTFELYTDKNLGLEAYQQALSRIEALWPSPKVLEVIEESLFRKPDAKAEAFNLEAYRELLMLYALAKEIIHPDSAALTPVKKPDLPDRQHQSGFSQSKTFLPTSIQPLSASAHAYEQFSDSLTTGSSLASVIPHASTRLGLDIDLDKLSFLPYSTSGLPATPKVKRLKGVQTDAYDAYDASGVSGASASLPASAGTPLPSTRSPAATDNLIDFDIFDVPPVAVNKPHLPKS